MLCVANDNLLIYQYVRLNNKNKTNEITFPDKSKKNSINVFGIFGAGSFSSGIAIQAPMNR